MTQRYAHLHNEVLREASEIIDNIDKAYWWIHNDRKIEKINIVDKQSLSGTIKDIYGNTVRRLIWPVP